MSERKHVKASLTVTIVSDGSEGTATLVVDEDLTYGAEHAAKPTSLEEAAREALAGVLVDLGYDA